MNILFIYPTVFNPIHGGVERVTDLLAKEFSRRNHNVFYAHHVKPTSNIELPFRTFFFPSEDYNSPVNREFYTKLLNELNIDIVINQCGAHGDSILYNHVYSTKAKVVSVIHFSPKMFLEHYWDEISSLRNNSLIEKIKRLGRCVLYPKLKRDYFLRLTNHYRWLFEHTDRICLLSDLFKNELESLAGDKYDARKVVAINNHVENPSEVSPNKEKVIIWVGRFDLKQKRPDLCLRVWSKINKHLPDWKLIMIGDVNDLDYIRDKAKNIERITFTGYVDPSPYYRRAKILITTSLTEGWGMVLTEAMTHGVVPMAFDSFLAVRDIISDEKQLVTPFDINEYAQKLTALISDEGGLSNALVGVQDSVERFSLSATAERWENLFKDILSD